MKKQNSPILRLEMPYCFCLVLFCLFPSLCDSLRHVNAQAVPMKNAYLDALPIHVQFASPIKCVELCATDIYCMSINYYEDSTCQLLKNYVCDGLHVLVSKLGAMHFDVEFDRTIQELARSSNKNDCINLNKCSPKCKDCTLGTTYTNIGVGRIVGNNIGIRIFRSVPQCKQDCVDLAECRAIELSSLACYMSGLTRDMVNPDAFKSDPALYYAERVCT